MTADQIAKILDELAAKLTGPASHVYNLYIRQMYIEGIVCTLAGIALIIIATILFRRGYKLSKKERRSEDEEFSIVLYWGTALFITLGIFFLVEFALFDFGNPEYQALSRIIAQIHP